jgi:lactate dehydrogenase-like 2-hydroxyacid dehydrogenase
MFRPDQFRRPVPGLPHFCLTAIIDGPCRTIQAANALPGEGRRSASSKPPSEVRLLKNVDVLMLSPMMPLIMEGIGREFSLHKAWEAPDRDALIKELGPRVRGLAPGSHYHVDGALMERLPKLEIIANFGVGYDTIDAAEARRRGILVTNTPDVLTEEVADLAVGLLIATVRQLPQVDRYLRAGKWLEKPYPLTATLRGRKVGILGLGRIGKAVAKRLEAFGLDIAYHGRKPQSDVSHRYYPTLVGMAKEVDVLMCVAPGGGETKGMVNAEVMRALGPEGVLINVGRGSVVDERALAEALRKKEILTAGLDVFEDEPKVPKELIAMDHIVLLPHVGSASVHTRNAMGQLVVDNLKSWFSGKGPLTPVAETPWTGRAA